jgi:CBS-domain-containing membrane protein
MFSIDKKFKKHKGHYVFQCLLVSVCLSVLFSMLNMVFEIALVAALGATTFIIFTGPFKELSQPRYIIGGYCIGTLVGLAGVYLFSITSAVHLFPVLSAFSVGVSMFLMVVLDYEHPPAAGVALGLMMNGGHLHSVAVAFIGIIFLLILRRLLSKFLIDLL